MLADVYGADYRGKTVESFSYISPVKDDLEAFCGATPKYPIGIAHNQTKITPKESAEILATTTLPYTDPALKIYSSIHSDPPGLYTSDAAVIKNRYGKGTCIYCTGPIEANVTQKQVFVNLIQSMISEKLIETNAPKPIEITLHKQTDDHRYQLSMVNFQCQVPNVPVYETEVSVAIPEKITEVRLLPEQIPLAFRCENGRVIFTVPCVDTLAMILLNYEG